MSRAHRVSKTEMVQAVLMGFQTQADVAKRVAGSQLPEEQMKQLVVARQAFSMEVSIVLPDQFVKLIAGDKSRHLSENVPTFIHILQFEKCFSSSHFRLNKSRSFLHVATA